MQWLELSVTVDTEAVESVSELFAQYGYNGGVAVEEAIIPSPDSPEYQIDTNKPVIVRTYLLANEQAADAQTQIERGLWVLGMMRPVGELQVKTIAEEDWANAWKEHYRTHRIGQRFVIVPSWLEYEPVENDVVLNLDPGMAFGTGLHPTTKLCLELMELIEFNDNTIVLDLGCGSGILAVGAAKLGSQRVLALDTESIAVAATTENAQINHAETAITALKGSLGNAPLEHWLGWEGDLPGGEAKSYHYANEFDVILANILAKVHVVLGNDYLTALKPGGVLITSGIINEREADVVAAFEAVGLEQVERRTQGDWVAFTHRKPA